MYLLAMMLISCAMFAPEARQGTVLSKALGVTARIESDAILKATFLDQDGPFGSVGFKLIVNGKVKEKKDLMQGGVWESVFTFVSVEKFDMPIQSNRSSRRESRSLSFHVGMHDVRAISAMVFDEFDPGSFFGVSSMPPGSAVVWTGGESTRGIRFVFTRLENGEWKRDVELLGRKIRSEASRSLADILEKHCSELPGVSSG